MKIEEATIIILLCIMVVGMVGVTYQAIQEAKYRTAVKQLLDPQEARPAKCRYLYDKGKHEEWAKCMGVEYK